jgi:hypothetical protein
VERVATQWGVHQQPGDPDGVLNGVSFRGAGGESVS